MIYTKEINKIKMDNETLYSEILNVADSINYTNDVVTKDADKLEEIADMLKYPPAPPIINIPDSVEINNLPEVQKVEVTNHEGIDLSTVEGLLDRLVELVPSLKDDRPVESIDKLADIIKKDKSRDQIVELLRAILDKEEKTFELPEDLKSKEGRIKVEVDRVGSFSGAGMLSTEDFKAKQDELIAAVNSMSTSVAYSTLIDDTGNYLYIGEAIPGSDESNSVWRIKRIDKTNEPDITIMWAGTSFNNKWTDRLTVSYT